jgi:hypothetical protein
MERRPIQYAAGSLAASAFVAVTQILTRDTVDLPLRIAVAAFAFAMPFQIVLFFAPLPPSRHKALSLSQTLYWHIQSWSTYIILFGFAALFWHFAWWVAILFAVAAYAAFRAYAFWATSPDFDEQDNDDTTPTV